MNILYEDNHIIVCEKSVGVLSEHADTLNMPDIIRKHFNDDTAYIGVVHRLDTAVGGVMVYAKTKFSAANLSEQIKNGQFKKEYLAVVSGCPKESNGTYSDFLFKDSSSNKVFVVKKERRGVKRAELEYAVLETIKLDDREISLVKIMLKTGRSHQIRVQFASRKMSLLGDGKYGSRIKCDIALFSSSISFLHPVTNEKICFTALPDNTFPFNKFDIKK